MLRRSIITPGVLRTTATGYSAQFSSSSLHHARSKAPKPTPVVETPSLPILQTIPFQQTPLTASHSLETAAASALGLQGIFKLLLSRFLANFGVEINSGLRRVAFRPLLLPCWRVDLSLKGVGALKSGNNVELIFTALDAGFSGFELDPLDKLSLSTDFEVEPEPFDPAIHLTQHDTAITVLPWTRSPMNALDTIKNLPTTDLENHGIDLNPRSLKPVLFAAYPLLIPVYLAEFQEIVPEEVEEPGRRITSVAFASVNRAFAVYPTFLPEPQWLPGGGRISISVSGVSADSNSPPQPGQLRIIEPLIDNLIKSALESASSFGERIKGLADVEGDVRVMGWDQAARNRHFIGLNEGLLSAVGAQRMVENTPDEAKVMAVGMGGMKMSTGKEMKEKTEQSVKEAQLTVKLLTPKWLRQSQNTKN